MNALILCYALFAHEHDTQAIELRCYRTTHAVVREAVSACKADEDHWTCEIIVSREGYVVIERTLAR